MTSGAVVRVDEEGGLLLLTDGWALVDGLARGVVLVDVGGVAVVLGMARVVDVEAVDVEAAVVEVVAGLADDGVLLCGDGAPQATTAARVATENAQR